MAQKKSRYQKAKRRAAASAQQKRNIVLEAFGLLDEFQSLSRERQRDLNEIFSRTIRIELTGNAAHTPAASRACSNFKKRFRWSLAFADPDDDDTAFGIEDYFRYVFPLTVVLSSRYRDISPSSPEMPPLWCALTKCLDTALAALYMDAAEAMSPARMDSCLLRFRLWTGADLRCRFEIRATLPDEIRVEKPDGVTRAYRATEPFSVNLGLGNEDTAPPAGAWPEDAPKNSPGARMLPVYVESHALARIIERLAPFPPVIAQLVMWDGIERSETTRAHDGNLLVKCVYAPTHHSPLGYLVAQRRPEYFLITTFLFLAMRGTPEGDRLRQMLHASTRDLAQHNLDRLETYLETDLLKDPDVRGIFQRCGLDHLADLFPDIAPDDRESGVADKFKDYFKRRIPKKEELGAIGRQLWNL